MTLDYRTATQTPPGKTGLTLWGVLMCVAGGFCVLGAVIAAVAFAFLTTVTATTVTTKVGSGPPVSVTTTSSGPTLATFPSGAKLTMLLGAGMYLVIGAFLLVVGIGVMRCKKWTRPVVLTLSGWIWITFLAGTPTALINTQYTPIPVFAVIVAIVAILGFGVALPLACFLFFRSDAAREALDHYDLTTPWTNRWPVPVFAVGAVAVLTAVAGICGAVGMLLALQGDLSTGTILLVLLQLALQVCLLAAGFSTFSRPPLGWTLVLVVLIANTALGLLMTFIAPDFQRHTAEMFAGKDSTIPLPPPSVAVLTLLLTLVGYGGILLVLRKYFFQPSLPSASETVGG